MLKSISAILVGFGSDVVLSKILGSTIHLLASILLFQKGIGDAETQFSVIVNSAIVKLMHVFVGGFSTMVGGYLCAMIIKSKAYVHAAIMASLSITITIYLLNITTLITPLWFIVIALLMPAPAAMIGAYVRLKQIEAKV